MLKREGRHSQDPMTIARSWAEPTSHPRDNVLSRLQRSQQQHRRRGFTPLPRDPPPPARGLCGPLPRGRGSLGTLCPPCPPLTPLHQARPTAGGFRGAPPLSSCGVCSTRRSRVGQGRSHSGAAGCGEACPPLGESESSQTTDLTPLSPTASLRTSGIFSSSRKEYPFPKTRKGKPLKTSPGRHTSETNSRNSSTFSKMAQKLSLVFTTSIKMPLDTPATCSLLTGRWPGDRSACSRTRRTAGPPHPGRTGSSAGPLRANWGRGEERSQSSFQKTPGRLSANASGPFCARVPGLPSWLCQCLSLSPR